MSSTKGILDVLYSSANMQEAGRYCTVYCTMAVGMEMNHNSFQTHKPNIGDIIGYIHTFY